MPLYFLIQTSYLICMHERRKEKRQDKETGKSTLVSDKSNTRSKDDPFI